MLCDVALYKFNVDIDIDMTLFVILGEGIYFMLLFYYSSCVNCAFYAKGFTYFSG